MPRRRGCPPAGVEPGRRALPVDDVRRTRRCTATFRVPDIEDQLADEGVAWVVLVQAADNRADSRAHALPGAVARRAWPVWSRGCRSTPPTRPRPSWTRGAASPIVGIGHRVHDERDPDWLLRPAVDDGLTLLTERRLTFDLRAHTPTVLRARRHPGREAPEAHGRPRPPRLPRRSPRSARATGTPGRTGRPCSGRSRRCRTSSPSCPGLATAAGPGWRPDAPAAVRRPRARGVRARPAHARQRLAVRAARGRLVRAGVARAAQHGRRAVGRRPRSWSSAGPPPGCTGSRSTPF